MGVLRVIKQYQVVELYAGAFFYPMPTGGASGGGGGGGGAGAGGFGGGGSGGGFSGGYISGSGTIISDFEGVIFIRYGDAPPYPVYVKPGKNEIFFFIPIILPVPAQGDFALVIEAQGTILIPAGFKIVRKAGTTLTPVPSFKIADKFGVRDFVSLEVQTIEPPVDLDDIADEYEIQDFLDIEIINATIKAFEVVDIVDMDDFLDFEHLIPVEPVNVDGIVDEVVLSDEQKSTLIPVNIRGTAHLDSVDIGDLVGIEQTKVTIKAENQLEAFDVIDVIKVEKE